MPYSDADVEKTQAPMDPRLQRELAHAEKQVHDRLCDLRESGGMLGRTMSADEIVAQMFRYQAPNSMTIPKYAAINQAAKNLAEVVLANCPSGADRAEAIKLIRMARMMANASVALDGLSLY